MKSSGRTANMAKANTAKPPPQKDLGTGAVGGIGRAIANALKKTKRDYNGG